MVSMFPFPWEFYEGGLSQVSKDGNCCLALVLRQIAVIPLEASFAYQAIWTSPLALRLPSHPLCEVRAEKQRVGLGVR